VVLPRRRTASPSCHRKRARFSGRWAGRPVPPGGHAGPRPLPDHDASRRAAPRCRPERPCRPHRRTPRPGGTVPAPAQGRRCRGQSTTRHPPAPAAHRDHPRDRWPTAHTQPRTAHAADRRGKPRTRYGRHEVPKSYSRRKPTGRLGRSRLVGGLRNQFSFGPSTGGGRTSRPPARRDGVVEVDVHPAGDVVDVAAGRGP
jgi:hypothetical protein